MHPALSVILFTTASGAGYGLLALLGLAGAVSLIPGDRSLGMLGLGLALLLVTVGLLASTAHLRHRERAWRAFSQWRSSWLSREGVMAVLTYPPALALALAWVSSGRPSPLLGLLACVAATLTVFCTGQIYASLRPVPRWHHPLTTPCYLLFALATGAVAATFVLHALGDESTWIEILALVALPLAWIVKARWWQRTDTAAPTATAGSATGLDRIGEVRLLEPPNTSSSYLMNEMGFRVARKHAAKLRRLAVLLGVGVAWPLLLLGWLLAPGILAVLMSLLATASTLTGTAIERWLFFAEAKHMVTLYYGAEVV